MYPTPLIYCHSEHLPLINFLNLKKDALKSESIFLLSYIDRVKSPLSEKKILLTYQSFAAFKYFLK